MSDVEDIVSIGQVIAAFNHCVDFGDGVGFGALFTLDGVLDMGHLRIEGRPALVDFANGVKDQVPNPRHLVSNSWIRVDGDRATAQSYAQVYVTPPGAPTALRTAGRYFDELERGADGWRLRLRTYVADLDEVGSGISSTA